MKTDLKYFLKTYHLSLSQKHLLSHQPRPMAHLYSHDSMTRNRLTRGGVSSALRRLKSLSLIMQEDGVWEINPPEMRTCYKAVGDKPELAEKLHWVELEDPYFWHPVFKSVFKLCIEVFGDKDKARQWMRSPILALGDQAPLDLLDSAEGIELVMHTLGRIEMGFIPEGSINNPPWGILGQAKFPGTGFPFSGIRNL